MFSYQNMCYQSQRKALNITEKNAEPWVYADLRKPQDPFYFSREEGTT